MEKKFKFSDNPGAARTVYGVIIAVLCITAIIVGIVASNNRKDGALTDEPPAPDNGTVDDTPTPPDGNEGEEEKKPNFISPVIGTVLKAHSTSIPAYSATLEAWKIHTGIDISTEEGADVFSVEDGEVTKVYAHPMLGNTVEITHEGGIVSRYSNLSETSLPTVGTKVDSGAKIGCVGDSAISELADEAHLHFEMLVSGVSVNPLDYISEESKSASLGIDVSEAA